MSDKSKLEKLAAAKKKLKEFQSKQKSDHFIVDDDETHPATLQNNDNPPAISTETTQTTSINPENIYEIKHQLVNDNVTALSANYLNQNHFQIPAPPIINNYATTTNFPYSFATSQFVDAFPSQIHQQQQIEHVAAAQQTNSNIEITQRIASDLSMERNQNHELQQKLSSQMIEINELRLTIDNMNRQSISQSTMQIAPLQAELQSQLQTIGILIGEKNDLNTQLLKIQQQFKEKSDEIDELHGRLNASRHRVQTLEKEIGQIRLSHTKYDNSQQKLCTELESTQDEMKALKKQNDELTEDVAEVQQKLMVKSKDSDNLHVEIANLKSELNLCQLRVEQFSAGDYIQVDNKMEKLLQEKSIIEQQVNELQGMIQQLGMERDQASQQYQNYVQHLSKESANLAQQVQELAADNERLLKRDAGLTKHVGDLERQIQQQLAKQKSLQETNQEVDTSAVVANENSIAELTKKCEDLESSRNALWDRIQKQYEPEIASLKQHLEEKLDTIDRLELTIERVQTESPNATNLLATIESDKVAASRAVAQNQQLKLQLDEIQKAYIQLSNDKLELTDRLQSEQHLGHEIKSKFHDIDSELQSTKDKLYFKDEEMIRLSHENVELNKELLQQSQELDRLRHYEATAAQSVDRDIRRMRDETVMRLRKRIAELEANKDKDCADASTTSDQQPLINSENEPLTNSSCCNDDLQHQHNILDTEQCTAHEITENNQNDLTHHQHLHQTQFDGSENGSISSTLNIAADQAMDRLQQRFTRTMSEVADLTEEKHRLEHLVLQLQGETETIGEYIALYQNQRRLLKQREIEKDIQLQQISVEREDMKENVVRLNNLVAQLLMQHGVDDAKQLIQNGVTSEQQLTTQSNNNEIVDRQHSVKETAINIHDVNTIKKEQKNIETASEIIKLLSEIKEKNLNHPGYGVSVLPDIHHCPCCSGKLEIV